MPTPVNVARQCLTEEAARALDEAVAVARRRSHAQTTSLHAVSALLALPSSALRDACARAKSRAYSSRLQFRALDLSVGVSLDRLPSAKTVEEPPVANSLMAAIKRSQANQRRHPDNFHLQQIHYNQQPASVLKVELKYLILSILDDPIVSRVFGEAGFQSREIKIAIAHPPITQIARFSRAAPMFLCNLTESSSPLGSSRPGFAFPFSNFNFNDADENGRVITEILMRARGNKRNPVLIGVSADECLKKFIECVNEGDKGGLLPRELSGLSVISIETEIKESVFEGGGGAGEGMMLGKFEELEKEVERCSGPGILVNSGDLEMLVGENIRNDLVSSLVMKLTCLLERFKEKLWFIGTAVSGDVYSKFLGRYPSVEKDWDLSLQPVSYSRKPSLGSNSSLMGSFVPFGGFFSDDFKNPSSSITQSISRCHLCTAKYEQEVSDIANTGSAVSAADQDSESIPSWLSRKGLDVAKTKDDGTTLNVKILGLQRKWNDICQRHHVQPFSQLDNLQPRPQVSVSKGFQYDPQRKETNSGSSRDSTLNQSQSADLRHGLKVGLRKEIPSSVTTDLGLGIHYSSKPREPEVPDAGSERLSGSDSSQHGTACENTSRRMAQSPLCSASSGGQFDSDSKLVRRSLAEKVNWQDGAVSAITEIISSYKAGCRGPQGLWLSFLGPDRVGKKKLASALAEVLFGSTDCFLSVDLSPVESKYDARPTTVVDRLASELLKRPRSVVFLEDVDKADFVTQTSLSHAIRTGKFLDSCGRETRKGNDNVIFVAATSILSGEACVKFPEQRILGCKSRQMRILVEQVAAPHATPNSVRASMKITSSSAMSAKRRKIEETLSDGTNQACNTSRTCLDLNLPVDEAEDTDSGSENSQALLDDFLGQVHKKVEFKPVDFDGLAEKMAKEIFTQFLRAFGSEIQLEVDEEVLVELLSAYWLLDQKGVIEDWIRNVLGGGFAEARQKCQISAQCVVKLVSCKGILQEQEAPGVGLPSRINL